MTDQHQAEPVVALSSEAPSPEATRSRALVTVAAPAHKTADDRPQADFLTQLIACERRLPAYRHARQAAPEAAVNAYGRTAVQLHARMNWVV